MIQVVVPSQLIEILIELQLDFTIPEQKPDENYIKIKFKNCPVEVNKYGMANYKHGLKIGKIHAK